MASQFFDQLAGPLKDVLPTESWYDKTIKYGISCDTKIKREDTVYFENRRPKASFTNLLTTFGTFEVRMQDDINISDGINVKVLNDYGQIDPTLLNEQLRLAGNKPENVNRMVYDVVNNINENMVSVLVNLIRFWIYKSTKTEKMVFKEDDIFYDDGHVAMSYKDYLLKGFNNNCVVQYGRMPGVIPFSEHSVLNSGSFVPNLTGFTDRDIQVLRIHLGDIKCSHPSRLLFDTPQLVDNIMLPNYNWEQPGSLVEPSADEIWQVMSKLVYANRCQSQFDLAYSIIVMAMYAPLPRAVEANAWVSPSNVMILPKVGSVRGITPALTSGAAYSSRPEAEITWPNFVKNRYRIFVHAIGACEALYGGIFEIMTAGGGMLTEFLGSFGVTSASMATPWRMMMECAAYRFGKPFETTWDTPCGPNLTGGLLVDRPEARDIQVIPKDDLQGYDAYTVKVKGEEVTRIRSKFMRPALFPVLSYGINDDRYYLNKKSYTAEMEFRPDIMSLVSSDADQVNKMMCIMRIAGLDCVVVDKFTGVRYQNWAANSNGQVMPIFNPNEKTSAYVMPVNTITERRINWLPVMSVLTKMKLSVEIKVQDYIVFAGGRNVGTYNMVYRPVTHIPRPMVRQDVTDFIIKTGAQSSGYHYQDFLLATVGIPVEKETVPSLAPLAMEPSQPTEEQVLEAGQRELLTEADLEETEV
nr:MAG: capsid protein [Totiviridae sp.]